jgi:uncharacterized protein (DUF1330 family)
VPALLIANIEVLDPAMYEDYKRGVEPTIAAFGGRYLARGGKVHQLEGQWSPNRFVVVEFPSAAQANAWWHSREYAAPKAIREKCAKTDMFIVEGM